ncbi:MAG: DMT family transporter [Coriobacteriales bacterium]|jgi:drug/metabolite transporter (DMT)-like permease
MVYRLLIIIATLIWGFSFVVVKDVTGALGPSWILVVRFLMAAVILFAVFYPQKEKRRLFFTREYLGYGAVLGCALFFAYWLQTIGITDTTPGKNAFLTACYCVIVPFISWAFTKRRPGGIKVFAAVLCVAGISLMSFQPGEGFSLSGGDWFTLACSFFYALHIVLVATISQGRDIYVLTTWQFFFLGIIALIPALLFEQVPAWGALSSQTWEGLCFLGIACSAVALLFQNVGQAHLPAASAAILLSLESPFGVMFSVAFGAETLTPTIICGFVVIFAAILVSELVPMLIEDRKKNSA